MRNPASFNQRMVEFSLLTHMQQKWRISRSLYKKRMWMRLVLIYLFFVVLFMNVQLFFRYRDTQSIRIKLMASGNGNSVVKGKNCTGSCADFVEEDDEHHPAEELSPSLRDSRGRPYTFQSLPVNQAEKDYYRLQKEKVNPFTYKYLIENPDLCDASTTMIVLVNSSPSNVARREAIRQTWGSLAKNGSWPHGRRIRGQVKLAFLFGVQPGGWHEKLLAENHVHGDIIQGDFVDSYRNMTLKSLLGMKWIVDHCSGVSYYLKSDDDMIINLPHLLDVLVARQNLRRTIMGPLAVGSRVYRAGKWSMNKVVYPFGTYPPYEPGAAYVMTADLVGELFQAAEYFRYIFIDDVYLTGILGRTLGVHHARQFGFAFWGTKPPSACDVLLDRVITGHKCFEKKLLTLWKEMGATTPARCKAGKARSPPSKT